MRKKQGLYFLTGFWLLSYPLSVLAATCINPIPETTASAEFTVHNDGTVTHKKTTLMWQVCLQGQAWSSTACSGTATSHDWQQALSIPSMINTSGGYAGYTDWRLPNIKELASIVELKCINSSINEAIFPDTDSAFSWSASPYINDAKRAWIINFGDGGNLIASRISTLKLRLVRDGQ